MGDADPEKRLRELLEPYEDWNSVDQIERALHEAVAIGAAFEREACAQAAEEAMRNGHGAGTGEHKAEGQRYCRDYGCWDGRDIARSIRARGAKP